MVSWSSESWSFWLRRAVNNQATAEKFPPNFGVGARRAQKSARGVQKFIFSPSWFYTSGWMVSLPSFQTVSVISLSFCVLSLSLLSGSLLPQVCRPEFHRTGTVQTPPVVGGGEGREGKERGGIGGKEGGRKREGKGKRQGSRKGREKGREGEKREIVGVRTEKEREIKRGTFQETVNIQQYMHILNL